MCGGAGQSHQFWGMTGGKSLGAIVMLWEEDKLPIFPTLNPTVQKAMSKNIPFQFHVLTAYNDIYLTKKAIETAGGTTDVGKIINAFETVDIEGVFGPFAYWGLKKEPWFHSGIITNPDDVYTWKNTNAYCPFNQIQGKDSYVLLQTQEGDAQQKFARPDLYKNPAELRAAAKKQINR